MLVGGLGLGYEPSINNMCSYYQNAVRLLEEGGVADAKYDRYVQIVESYNEARAKLENRMGKGL